MKSCTTLILSTEKCQVRLTWTAIVPIWIKSEASQLSAFWKSVNKQTALTLLVGMKRGQCILTENINQTACAFLLLPQEMSSRNFP
jgi:hypothetical protein